MTVAWPTRTPATSVIAFSGLVGSRLTLMPRSWRRARPIELLRIVWWLELGPGRFVRSQPAVATGQCTGLQPFQAFEPKEREAAPLCAASHLSCLLVAEHDRRAGGGHRTVDADWEEALADEAAILGA